MAVITAQATIDPIAENWAIPLHHRLLQGSPGGVYGPDQYAIGLNASQMVKVPTTVDPRHLNADKVWEFTDIFYNRIAVLPSFIDAGSVSSAQQFQVEVWNGFFANRQHTALNKVNADGIVVSGGLPVGATFLQLHSSVYDITVLADGPPTIDAFLSWVFSADEGTVNIIGSRLSVFAFEPDTKLQESLRWLTDVHKAYSGEQRVRLRNDARQVFEFVTQADGEVQTRLNSIMYGWQDKVFALPYWPDVVKHVAPISALDTEIFIDTANLDFRDGGLALIWTDDIWNEAVEIDTVQADRLVLLREVVNNYDDGALIIPLLRCRAQGGLRRQIGRMDDTRSTITFRGMDNTNIDGQSVTWTTYKSYEVWDDLNAQFGSINSSVVLPLKFLDNQTGYFRAYPTRSITEETNLQGFVVRGAAERLNLKKYLYRRLGRLKPFWLESYREDYELVQTIGASAVTMVVKYSNQKFLDIAALGYALKFVFTDGSVEYRDYVGLQAEDLAARTEEIEFDASIGVDVLPEDIERISIMRLVRFDTDNIVLEHTIGDGIVTSVTVPLISIKYPEAS